MRHVVGDMPLRPAEPSIAPALAILAVADLAFLLVDDLALRGVPLPGGRRTPSGPIEMSQSTRSASVTGCPRSGLSADNAAPAENASVAATANRLGVDIPGLSLAVDRPALDHVHVPHREGGDGHIDTGLATLGRKLGTRRLHVAGLVPSATLQHDRLTVPAPGQAEAGQSLAQHRVLQRRLRPTPAAVGRNHDLGDAPVARVGEAGNLVEARPFQR